MLVNRPVDSASGGAPDDRCAAVGVPSPGWPGLFFDAGGGVAACGPAHRRRCVALAAGATVSARSPLGSLRAGRSQPPVDSAAHSWWERRVRRSRLAATQIRRAGARLTQVVESGQRRGWRRGVDWWRSAPMLGGHANGTGGVPPERPGSARSARVHRRTGGAPGGVGTTHGGAKAPAVAVPPVRRDVRVQPVMAVARGT